MDINACSEPPQQSKMELFPKTVHSFMPLVTFFKSSILDVQLGSEYASADSKPVLTFSKNQTADLFAN